MKDILKQAAILLLFIFSANLYAEIVEVVVFSAKEGVSDERVLGAAEGMLDTMKKWDGFISRELIRVGGGKWIDVVHWRDIASAEAAQHKAMDSDLCLLFFSLLDDTNQQVYHGDKLLSQAK